MNHHAKGFGPRDGAVYVEFLIAFLPILTLFLCLVQLILLFTADIVVRHAAWSAVRAAIVVLPDDPKNSKDPEADILRAAKSVCLASPAISQNSVTVDTNKVERSSKSDVTATVSATYRCQVMIANLIMCPGGSLTLRARATMPNQGADYEY